VSASRTVATAPAGGSHGRRRIGGLVATEARLARRMGVVTAAAAVTVLWTAVVLMLGAEVRETVVPLILFTDVTALGFLFVPALLVVERVDRCDAAMRLTPLRPRERLGVRVGMTTVLSVAAAAILTTVAGVSDVAVRLLGVTTSSLLFGLIAYAMLGTSSTLTTFLTRAPLVAVPLITPALVSYGNLSTTPLLVLSPLTSALHMMAGRMSWSGLGLQLACVAGVAAVAAASADLPVLDHPTTPRRRLAHRQAPDHPGHYRRVSAVRSFVRTDRRALTGDALLLMLAVSVPLVALAARALGSAGVHWVRQRYATDLALHLPLIWALLLVFHTPVTFGALTGLLLLEERDEHLLPVIAATRASLATLLGYRLGATAAVTAIALAVSMPLAGVTHHAGATGLFGVVAAAAVFSAVPALLMAGLASNRVQGVAVMKIIGLPLYLPLASWFLPEAARWIFAPLPSTWIAWALWAVTLPGALTTACVSVALTVVVAAPLVRRFLDRATRSDAA
jgi:fluoroquinolone transport system permease protein